MSSFQTSNFNFKLIDPRQKILKECKAYIREYFVPLRDGNHAVLEDGKYVLKDEATLKKVYFNRMPIYTVGGEDDDGKKVDLSNVYSRNILTSAR